MSDNRERQRGDGGRVTYPETLGISAGHGVYGGTRLVDEDGGDDMNAADEF